MEPEFQDYYDVLSYNLESYKGEYAPFIDNGPALFKFLNDLLISKELASEYRLKISAAIAYYVAPMDVIPEQIYGPYGYIDDIFITAYVIKLLADEHGFSYLEKFWEGDKELKVVVEECYDKSSEILEDKIREVLDFVGL
jgi:uncharacterized membrane protein YkvA (DUF1232 family)